MDIDNITPWRREHMTNMVNAFDFGAPDMSIPGIADVREPEGLEGEHWSGDLSLGSLTGPWVGPSKCLNGFEHGNYPTIPYGEANLQQDMDSLVEDGFKQLRGSITEGRYITIETDGLGLTRTKKGNVIAAEILKKHQDIQQRWILHTSDNNRFGNSFYLQSAAMDKPYISTNGSLTTDPSDAQPFLFDYTALGATFTLQLDNAGEGEYVSFAKKEKPNDKCRGVGSIDWKGEASKFQIFGVNYKDAKKQEQKEE
jgi:phospholipase C